jgi:hypothetical protein
MFTLIVKSTISKNLHPLGCMVLKIGNKKEAKREQKNIGLKTMFVQIVTNCKKYNKVIVKSTIRLVYV